MQCSIKLKSFNLLLLEKITEACIKEAKTWQLEKASLIRLPKKLRKFSLIRSPHVHKKSREQFEMLSYNRLIHLEGSEENLQSLIEKTIAGNKHTFYYKVEWHA